MRSPSPLSSGAFRFALAMALVFALGAGALLVVVRQAIDGYTADAVADGVDSELDILIGEDRQLGRRELVDAIARHERAVREHDLRLLLRAADGRIVAGSLPPRLAVAGWHHWRLRERRGNTVVLTPLLAHGLALSDGALLVVASDTTDLTRLRARLLRFTAGFGGAIAILVALGGLVTGSVFLGRLDRVNRVIDRIVAGRFSERLPRIGMGAEFDALSRNLNVMLERIETLMDGLRQVTVDLAHDLRTPLTRLRQQLEHLQQQAPPDMATLIERPLAQADEVLAVFAALLRIGTMESGAARALFGPVDLAELLQRIAAAYAPEIEDGGRSLTLALAGPVVALGDRELLAQGIANLVENAAAHTAIGTRVVMRALRDAEAAIIIVEDDGSGVPIEERDRVTRRFYRLDRSRSTPGAGLGLALVSAIVGLHDGTLALEDAAPGLRVVVRLPLFDAGLSVR